MRVPPDGTRAPWSRMSPLMWLPELPGRRAGAPPPMWLPDEGRLAEEPLDMWLPPDGRGEDDRVEDEPPPEYEPLREWEPLLIDPLLWLGPRLLLYEEPLLREEEDPPPPRRDWPQTWALGRKAKMAAAVIIAANLVKCFIRQWY